MQLDFFYIPWKHQETSDFLIFSGGKKETSVMKWVNRNINLTH